MADPEHSIYSAQARAIDKRTARELDKMIARKQRTEAKLRQYGLKPHRPLAKMMKVK